MKKYYWESVMKRIAYGTDSQVRQKCVIHERGNPDPIAECWDVTVADLVVDCLNHMEEKQ